VNLSGYDISGIVSFNSISAVFVSVSSQVGFGRGVLGGNTGTNIVALGTSAGTGGSTSNVVYLGSNPGYNPTSNNMFLVYSTSAGIPFLQGDVSSRILGVGRFPRTSYALDVSGGIYGNTIVTAGGSVNQIGSVYTVLGGNVGIGTASPGYDLDVVGTIHGSNIVTDGVGFTNTIGGITLSNTTLSAATIRAVALNATTVSAGTLLFGDVVALGFNSLSGNTASYANALGYNAGSANSESNCTFIGTNPIPTSSGATQPNTFLVYSTSAAPTIQADTSNNYVGIGKIPGPFALDVSGTANVITLSAQTVTTTSININSTVVGLGLNSLSGNTAQNANGLGQNAGWGNSFSNCTFIGSNPNPTSSGATQTNTFLVYSTVTNAPTIQADTSNNYVGIGRVPEAYALDVSGQIRTTSSIINTINVSLISSSSFSLGITNYSTYFNLVYTGGSIVTISLPGTLSIEGSYWVVKNNSPVNYTLNFTGGFLNTVGTSSMFLQAGNGLTLIYSGANSVYYTF
jgi:hypothetical protein